MPANVRIEPLIVNIGVDNSSAPFIVDRGYPTAIKGQAYSHQMTINNLGIYEVHALTLPTGLTLDSTTGLITGTPVGMSLVHGMLWRFSAFCTDVTIRNFYSTAGIATSGNRFISLGNTARVSNLHRLRNFMIRGCRYGLYIERGFDSHISSGYIAGCRSGIRMESGGAAIRFTDLRIEFISRYGIDIAFANENQFQNCFFDTCGWSAIKAENCKALMVQGCMFFRSGRLEPGTDIPTLPQANRERSNHIRLVSCKKATITGNTFLVGRNAEGASNNYLPFDGVKDYARPATTLSSFGNEYLLFADNQATGCCHESYASSSNTKSTFKGNQFNQTYFEERFSPVAHIGNLIRNSDFSLNSRAPSYTRVAGSATGGTPIMEFWELRAGTLTQDITITQEQVNDAKVPFKSAIRIQKLAETGAVAGQTQNLNISTTNQLREELERHRGTVMQLSFWTKALTDARVQTQFTFVPAAAGYTTTDIFERSFIMRNFWQQHSVLVQVPNYFLADIGSSFNPSTICRLLFDEANLDYDAMVSGIYLEPVQDGHYPSKFYEPEATALRDEGMAKVYMKTLKTDLYVGVAGSGFSPAGTVQFIATGIGNPTVNVQFPVPLENDSNADSLQIVSYRDAASRAFANFDSVSQIPGGTPHTYNILQRNRYGFTLEVTSTPPAGTRLAFHYEVGDI